MDKSEMKKEMPDKGKSEKPKSKKSSPWISFVKAYAKKNKMKYNEALKDPKLKAAYAKSKKSKK